MKQPCGCCAVESATPEAEANRPGLPAIAYRAGTYATFFETMLARLTTLRLETVAPDGAAGDVIAPLQGLATRDPGDPSIALLDAWAILADVLAFYQERIANEGYLQTATERRSIFELARLVGYRPRPGVASSVYLAFTVSKGFAGDIPAGTRAQSIPAAGEKPQFFETSEKLFAREAWNNLAVRLTRPQTITPPGVDPKSAGPVATGVDVTDAIYFEGVSTNLKPGDALLFVFGPNTATAAPQQFLRFVESVDPQAERKRTEATLVLPPLFFGGDLARLVTSAVQPFIDKAKTLFPGSDVAGPAASGDSIADALQRLLDNVGAAVSATEAAAFVLGAVPPVQRGRDLAQKRGFTRLAAWAGHVAQTLHALAGRLADASSRVEIAAHVPGAAARRPALALAAPNRATSPLATLGATLQRLAKPPSVQPASAQRLARSVKQAFAPQSDIAPRLLAAFRPSVAATLYEAWANVEAPAKRVEAQAMRVKAKFFASNYPGAPVVVRRGGTFTVFLPPTLGARTPALITFEPARALGLSAGWPPSVWGDLVTDHQPVATIPLDATYDQIKPKSWVAIDRPTGFKNMGSAEEPAWVATDRVTTTHLVTAARAASMDSGTGFSAKVTLLTLAPPWLSDADDIGAVLSADPRSTMVLRESVIYAQSEPLTLAEEPLDLDVAGDRIELAGLYDGLEPGRWIIVSGQRTDIPNVSGVTTSERAMIAAVEQGARAASCAAAGPDFVPFSEISYVTEANAFGDRLAVGKLSSDGAARLFERDFPAPAFPNQTYCGEIELAPGAFANAYVPSAAELDGDFSDFTGLLQGPLGLPGGNVALQAGDVFAWRISTEPVRTILTLAKKLAYTYDAGTITLYGNVVEATHGQTVAQALGNGDASQAFQCFALNQGPLTYLSAPTPAGAQSTLTVRVNDLAWREADHLPALGPTDRGYVTKTDDADRTSAIFGDGAHGALLPTGGVNIKAVYRYGVGKAGNVKARQISQLASQPLGAQGVINPLPATGGADHDSVVQARQNTPLAVKALDRLVGVEDYADFARVFAGVGKAVAARLSDGRRQLVHVTIAGVDDIPIAVDSDLYRNLTQALHDFGDPYLPVQVAVRTLELLVVSAGVGLLPDYDWETVEPRVRAALLDAFSFDNRALGQSAFLSEAVSVMQRVDGVAYVDVDVFDSVSQDIDVTDLARLATTLRARPVVPAALATVGATAGPGASIRPAELVFLTPDIPNALILTEISG